MKIESWILKSEQSEEEEDLEEMLQQVKKFNFYFGAANNFLLTLGIIVVIVMIWRRQGFKFLPWKLKLSLIGWLVVAVGFDSYEVFCAKEYSLGICGESVAAFILRVD